MKTTRRTVLLAALGIQASLAAGCRDHGTPVEPQPGNTSYETVTLDTAGIGTIRDVIVDWWDGVTLMRSGTATQVVALDNMWGRLRYYRCASLCDSAAAWTGVTVDNGPAWPYMGGSLQAPSGTTSTPAGIAAVATVALPDSGGRPQVRYVQCAGTCGDAGSWTVADLFPGASVMPGKPLTADAAGTLHLLLRYPDSLTYAECSGNCGVSSSWRTLAIDTAYHTLWASVAPAWSRGLVAASPGGGVQVFYVGSGGLVHAGCAANCTAGGSWQSSVAVAGVSAPGNEPFALAFVSGADGRMHLAYADSSGAVRYGECGGSCAGTWAMTSLPFQTSGLAMATDAAGRVFLATTHATVTVSTCASSCLNIGNWVVSAADAAAGGSLPGGGSVALAVDSTGRARVASSETVMFRLQYSQARP